MNCTKMINSVSIDRDRLSDAVRSALAFAPVRGPVGRTSLDKQVLNSGDKNEIVLG